MSRAFVLAANSLELFERWVTPFYRFSDNLPRRRILENFYAPFESGNIPVTVQIMGVDSTILAQGAKVFCDLGASGIDLNCGCPSRQVTSGGAGGGALRNIDNVLRILEAVKLQIGDMPLSIKLRTGWSDWHEELEFLPRLAKLGVLSHITVHFRTVSEQYSMVEGREVRWRSAIEASGGVPIILNGDLNSVEELQELPQKLGAYGAMSARGILRDPFLLRRAQSYSAPSLEAGRQLFFDTVQKSTPEGITVGQAIELSNFIWGKNNPHFARLVREKKC